MINDQLLQYLSQYQHDEVINLNHVLAQPAGNLFKTLKQRYKKEYQPLERIVLTWHGDMPQSTVDYLQRVVTFLDISNCFVLLATNDQQLSTKLWQAKAYRYDDSQFEVFITDIENPKVDIDHSQFVMPESVCMNPWARLEVITDGSVKPCCVFSTPLKDNTGKPFNIQTHSLEEVYFSDDLNSLRQEFLSGVKPQRCQSCWNHERHGLKSIRQHSQWELNQHQFDLDWKHLVIENLKSVSMALGNVCNLRCRICGPDQSSAWAAESIQQLPKQERKSSALYQILQNKSWVYKDLDFWEDFYGLLPYISELKFVGGEPMLIDQHIQVLKDIIDRKHSDHIDLVYNTNGTVYPDHAIEHWKRFRSVTVAFSIDDIEDRFEYQRFGAQWDQVHENIHKYLELRTQFNIKFAVNSTVSTMNVLYLEQLLKWFDDIEVDDIRLAVLLYPSSLSISNMTDQAKQAVMQQLRSINATKIVQPQLDGIVSFVKHSTSNTGNMFIDYTKKLDHIRHQKFSDSHAEMAQLMNYI